MRLSTAVTLALSVLLAALTVGTVVIAPATAATSTADESAALSTSQSRLASATLESSVQDADQEYEPERADTWQVIRLNVTEDGDVRWTLESRFRLSENETDQFEQYAEAVANGDRDGDVGYDVDKYDQARVLAEHSTDREMAFENESWNDPRIESRDGQKLGIISYSFTWTNFADVDGQQIRFGDAFETDDGVWLQSLGDGQRFVVESPPNYGFKDAPTGIENGTIVYEGPKSFTEGDFETVFFRTDSPGGSDGTPSEPEPEPLSESVFTAEGIAAAFGGFVLVIVGAALLISRYQRSEWPFDDASAADEFPAGSVRPRSTETDGSGTTAVAPAADQTGIEHEFDETEAVDAGPDGDTDDAIDEELLSDDERVRRLLERNGGRMKQATIVKVTGWSDAKVSQLLSEMDDDDRIRKLRIGRENLITLPDVDPTEID